MKYEVVSVRDRAADAYGRPIFVNSLGLAIRSFQDEINRRAPDNEMNRHPEDFDLYSIGTFDDEKGLFDNLNGGPKQIAIGNQMISEVHRHDA